MKEFTVTADLDGKTIKEYFRAQGFSTAQIKRFKYNGKIVANGNVVTVRYVLKCGDVIRLETNKRLAEPAFSQEKANILYKDEYLYIAEKPYGIAVHPDRTHKTETLGNRLATTFGKGFELRIVTRLDKITSGLVLGAFDEITAQKLNEMQIRHQIQKQYVALTEGTFKMANCDIDELEKQYSDFDMSQENSHISDLKNYCNIDVCTQFKKDLQLYKSDLYTFDGHCGKINMPLLRDDRLGKTVVADNGKPSVTLFEVTEQCALSAALPTPNMTENVDISAQKCIDNDEKRTCTKLMVTPLTGRTHQIRAHLAAIGHPIVGDELYGGKPHRRVMLHCCRLTFTHPITDKTVDVFLPAVPPHGVLPHGTKS